MIRPALLVGIVLVTRLAAFLLSPSVGPSGTRPASAEGVTKLAAGGSHTCAITTPGALKCWGSPVGDGTGELRPIPVDVVGLTSGVSAVAGGDDHTCAVVTGAVKCWGFNYHGQLGNGT